MNNIRKFISHPVFYVIAFLGTGYAIFQSNYSRRALDASFKSISYISYIFLILSFIVFLITYKDKREDTKALIRESVTGYIFFIGFMALTFILRG